MFELHKAQRFAHALLDFLLRNVAFFEQTVGYVFTHGERVEQSAFLKYDSNFTPQVEELGLTHVDDVFTKHADAALIRFQQPERQLHNTAFALSVHTENGLGFSVGEPE